MVPRLARLRCRAAAAPRARGDGPRRGDRDRTGLTCSPRTRGWSRHRRHHRRPARLLPAHAGMVPAPSAPRPPRRAAPRARGDGPTLGGALALLRDCSPRTRGWSHADHRLQVGVDLLPAHAGMVPQLQKPLGAAGAAPRARGDGPPGLYGPLALSACSPRTRGWSPRPPRQPGLPALLPAHAGMVPPPRPAAPNPGPAPRARGDGPLHPGDEVSIAACSPRTRGWSRRDGSRPNVVDLLPAHAGMVPRCGRTGPTSATAPRARGDGPPGRAGALLPRALLPAHAGMVPGSAAPRSWPPTAPRARGDGPRPASRTRPPGSCSPRTRGWSRRPEDARREVPLLPAHAGMVPHGSRGK